LTTKVHMACDSLGRPIRFLIAAGQSHDILAAPALIEGMTPDAVVADRAYDSNALRQAIDRAGAEAVIPSTRSRKAAIPHDRVLYRLRNASNAASTNSSTSAASQPATIASPDTSSPSPISPQLPSG
jgi:transposase